MGRAMRWGVLLLAVGACAPVGGETTDATDRAQAACKPLTCAEAGAQCGNLPDGCGGSVQCGGCIGPTVCRLQGTAFRCVPAEPCVPLTCAALGATCGTPDDGCGGTLDCGGCAEGESCGGAGLALACGDPGRTPETVWVTVLDTGVGALVARPHGELVLSRWTPAGAALLQLDAAGNVQWSRDGFRAGLRFDGLSVAGSGQLYAWGFQDRESGYPSGSAYRFDASGQTPEEVGFCGYDCSVGPYFADANGNVVSHGQGAAGRTIRHESPQGLRWTYAWGAFGGGTSPVAFDTLAPAPEAGLLTGGNVERPGDAWGRHFGDPLRSTCALLAFDALGGLRWSRELAASCQVRALAGDEAGGLFGAGQLLGRLDSREGSLRTGPGHLLFVFRVDASGQPEWFRRVEGSWGPELARGPQGRLAVMTSTLLDTRTACQGLRVTELDAAGNVRWSRVLGSAPCTTSYSAAGLAYSGEDVVLAGSFKGTADLGDGVPHDSGPGWKGFVVKLRAP